ncbi:MAG: YdjY domain-containing protein [Pirellulaceae bacterium]
MTRHIVAIGPPVRGNRSAAAWLAGKSRLITAMLVAAAGCFCGDACMEGVGRAEETEARFQAAPPQDAPAEIAGQKLPARLEPAKGWLRVTKDNDVWIDFQHKQVVAGGRICLREGLLEMFACPEGTKEHESIVAVHTPARYVHAALVALGAQPGPPVQFEPTYKPAQGTEVTVEVLWKDEQGKEQRVMAQHWVKHVKTGKELTYPWVFAGSGFWTDEEGKEQFYLGDGGEFICVSNFSTATLDLPVESSAENDTLLFAAFTERIPPRDTPVMLFLTPKLEKPGRETEPTEPATAPQPAKPQPEKPQPEKPESAKPESAKPEAAKPEAAKAADEAPTAAPSGGTESANSAPAPTP